MTKCPLQNLIFDKAEEVIEFIIRIGWNQGIALPDLQDTLCVKLKGIEPPFCIGLKTLFFIYLDVKQKNV